ncbi:unnamed protein product [Albugo candida]|uniref:Uncharacterized protein n=1 Tax=Albugo candida TaxID=65357 RepID=A0A024GV80_9STRA|nr:unnamed protein product [Albugo candida]|eukprot:CCI50284.1 unnamed protein product [Albugo candida]
MAFTLHRTNKVRSHKRVKNCGSLAVTIERREEKSEGPTLLMQSRSLIISLSGEYMEQLEWLVSSTLLNQNARLLSSHFRSLSNLPNTSSLQWFMSTLSVLLSSSSWPSPVPVPIQSFAIPRTICINWCVRNEEEFRVKCPFCSEFMQIVQDSNCKGCSPFCFTSKTKPVAPDS